MTSQLALALSGGGVRAMAFHAGVLRFLASKNQLENVRELSTVSGGSLVIGLVFAKAGMQWPTSTQYLKDVHPRLKQTLMNTDLQMSMLGRLIFRGQLRFLTSRPNILARAIYEEWRVRATLGDLPQAPVWSINCTTAETGKRFRFKEGQLGDHNTGYARTYKFPLASAMAISAAFPVGIGPFRLYATRLEWWRKPYWNAPREERIPTPFKNIHLYDGGVYDNLGLEPFFDAGKAEARTNCRIIVSDAGAPLTRGFDIGALNPLRMKRIVDLIMDQNRSLRVRGFINHLQKSDGAYIGIRRTSNMRKALQTVGAGHSWLSDEQAALASAFPTCLRAMREEDFNLVDAHGFETAKLTQLAFPYL